MRVGWLIPTVGTFGAVREMVEVSNVLVRRGHQVTIYHPDGGPVKWLESLSDCQPLSHLNNRTRPLDALIGIVDWDPALYTYVTEPPARLKAVCLMGFEPSQAFAQALRSEIPPRDNADRILVDAMRRGYLLMADSSWQVEWVQEHVGYPAGPAFGGINLAMFHGRPMRQRNQPVRIIYSGDPRERKGTDTVLSALERLKTRFGDQIETDSYWGRRLDQAQLVEFLQQADIFLDGHRRAGWCNPVAEAMACGCVPVCTDIGAVRDFAIHERTALVVPVNDDEAMAEQAARLVEDEWLWQRLRSRGISQISRYDYQLVGAALERFLLERLNS